MKFYWIGKSLGFILQIIANFAVFNLTTTRNEDLEIEIVASKRTL